MGPIHTITRKQVTYHHRFDRTARGSDWSEVLIAAFTWAAQASERWRSRRALQDLSDEQLKDIGISRADAYREFRRPFWD